MLSTKAKMRIARALNRIIVGARASIGRDAIVRVRRGGVNWRLDLNEGIDLAIYLGVYQAIPSRVISEWIRPESLVIDIGANIGSHCLPMARRLGPAGRVLAIEPTDYAFAKLVANADLNRDMRQRIVPVQAMLGEHSDRPAAPARVYSRWPLSSGPDRHAEHLGQLETAAGARFATLDGLLDELRKAHRIANPVSFVKLDVDGSELGVLLGGRRTFGVERPPMLIEIAPHSQDEVPKRFEALLTTLGGFGYRLEEAGTGKPMPMSADGLRKLIKHGASVDAVARPTR